MEGILSASNDQEKWQITLDITRITHIKNWIQLIKKLLSFGLRNEGFRLVGIEMEILNFRLFSLQFFLTKTKDMKYFLTWAQNGKPKDELSLSTSKDATIRSPDIVQIIKTGEQRAVLLQSVCWYLILPPTSHRQILKFIGILCCVKLCYMYYSITVLAVIITKRLQ